MARIWPPVVTAVMVCAVFSFACKTDEEEPSSSASPSSSVTGKGPRGSPTSSPAASSAEGPTQTPLPGMTQELSSFISTPVFENFKSLFGADGGFEFVAAEPMQWPDHCVGLVSAGRCDRSPEPIGGYRITVRAYGNDYYYHLPVDGGLWFAGLVNSREFAIQQAKDELNALTGIDPETVEAVGVDELVWPGCLGFASGAGACPAFSAGPGFRIRMTAPGKEFIFRATRAGAVGCENC